MGGPVSKLALRELNRLLIEMRYELTNNSRGNGRIFKRKGSALYWCAYNLRGEEYRESTGTSDPIQATRFLKRRIREIGADQIGASTFVGPQQERMKVSSLLDALEEDYKLRGKVSPQFKTHLKQIRRHFNYWRAVDITAEAVDKYISARLEQGSAPATINRSTQLLAQAFKLVIERRHLSNAPRIRHLSEKGNERRGFFTDGDFRRLRQTLREDLRDYCEFGYLTGWRKGEIASLRWEDIDGELLELRGEYAKNKEPRSMILSGNLEALIARRRAERKYEAGGLWLLSEYVFHRKGKPIGDFRKSWVTTCVAIGLGQYHCAVCDKAVAEAICPGCNRKCRYIGRLFHDFRRTAVRNMVRAGVPERVAMTISGHKTRSVFDRYNIVNEEDLRDAIERTQTYLNEGGQKAKPAGVVRMWRARQ
jgi:integrase